MSEYKDQSTWFELDGYDGFQWEFIADFDTREEAETYGSLVDFGYEETRIRRVSGLGK